MEAALMKALRITPSTHARIQHEGSQAPKLEGQHAPSTAPTSSLDEITIPQLNEHHRNSGKIIYLRVLETTALLGAVLRVLDRNGIEGEVWSLMAHPLGVPTLPNDTLIAVKEPYFGRGLHDRLAICIHHPFDCIHVSKFEPKVRNLFLDLAPVGDVDFVKSGDSAALNNNLLLAHDCYSRGLAQVESNGPSASEDRLKLLMKRALCNLRLGALAAAFADFEAYLAVDPVKEQVLKHAVACAQELGRLDEALTYGRKLVKVAPGRPLNAKLMEDIQSTEKRASSKVDMALVVQDSQGTCPGKSASTFKGRIEVRESSLGGQGVFATSTLAAGELVLLEKPMAISRIERSTSGIDGVNGAMESSNTRWTGNTMKLLQQLADKCYIDPKAGILEVLISLHANSDNWLRYGRSQAGVFNSYHIINILESNKHHLNSVSASMLHDHADFFSKTTKLEGLEELCGLWALGSKINHSCLPNCQWSWIGGHFVKRRDALKREYGFDCDCVLCLADLSLPDDEKKKRVVTGQVLVQHLVMYADQMSDDSATNLLAEVIKTYHTSVYDNLAKPMQAELSHQMVALLLGRVNEWNDTTPGNQDCASYFFGQILTNGLNMGFLMDEESGYCEIILKKHSSIKLIGILALMGIAELCFMNGHKNRCRNAKFCAKQLYEIFYGENVTFEKKHSSYRCFKEPAIRGPEPDTQEWAEEKAKAQEPTTRTESCRKENGLYWRRLWLPEKPSQT